MMEQRAKMRRRVFLSLFGLFLVVSLLVMVFIANQMLREFPPDNLPELAEKSSADGVWYFRHRPLPEALRDFFTEELNEPAPEEDLQRLSALLHPVGTILVFESPKGSHWVLVAPVRKPQRVFQNYLERLVQNLERENLHVEFDTRRVLISDDTEQMTTVKEVLGTLKPDRTGGSDPQARILAPGEAYLVYDGPWNLLPERLRSEMAPSLKDWPATAELEEWPVRLSWIRMDDYDNARLSIPIMGSYTLDEVCTIIGAPYAELDPDANSVVGVFEGLSAFATAADTESNLLVWDDQE